MHRDLHISAWIGAGAVALMLYGLNAWFGPLNHDEGWYLYAARLFNEGQLPYADFAFTQGPVLPMVYALFYPLVEAQGVLGGRMVTAGFGVLSLLLATVLAARLAPKPQRATAALIAFILVGVNVYQAYFTSVVKTYGLCAFFLTAGLLFLVRAAGRSRVVVAPVMAAVLLVFAAGTRLSAGIALPLAGLYLLCNRRKLGDRNWLLFGGVGLFALAALFYPFFVGNPKGFLFGLLEYHAQRDAGDSLLAFKGGFISRVTSAYFVPLVLLIATWFLQLTRNRHAEVEEDAERGVRGLVWAIVVGMSLVHFMTPFPYDDYQAVVFPLFVAVLAPAFWRACLHGHELTRRLAALPLLILLVATGAAFSSPVNQDWFLIGRELIWWKMKEEPDILRLRRAASEVKERARGSDTVLTQDTYLAVEAGLRVPVGMEMGVFSYYPDIEKKRAAELKVLNHEMMLELLKTSEAPVAALSGYAFRVAAPKVERVSPERGAELQAALEARYAREDLSLPDFGQGHTELRMYLLKGEAEEVISDK